MIINKSAYPPAILSRAEPWERAHVTVDSAVREGSHRHVYTQDTQRVLGEVQCELGHRGVATQLYVRVFLLPFNGRYNFTEQRISV